MTGDEFFCDEPWALGRGRSQSIVALENVNGTSLKGTPLPDESDYRITDVEAGRKTEGTRDRDANDVVQNIDRCQLRSLLTDTSRIA